MNNQDLFTFHIQGATVAESIHDGNNSYDYRSGSISGIINVGSSVTVSGNIRIETNLAPFSLL